VLWATKLNDSWHVSVHGKRVSIVVHIAQEIVLYCGMGLVADRKIPFRSTLNIGPINPNVVPPIRARLLMSHAECVLQLVHRYPEHVATWVLELELL